MMASKELGGEEAGRVLYTVGRGVLWHFFRYTSDPPAAHSRVERVGLHKYSYRAP